jgi:PTS system ascorbate-specific IIC component
MPIFLMPVMGNLGFAGSTFSDTDYGVVGIFMGSIANVGGQIAVISGIVAVLVVMILMTIFGKKQQTTN